MNEELDQKKEISVDRVPASLVKRMIAFGMDAVLLFILIQAIALLIPNLYHESAQAEFNALVHKVSLLGSDERFDSSKMAMFIEELRRCFPWKNPYSIDYKRRFNNNAAYPFFITWLIKFLPLFV